MPELLEAARLRWPRVDENVCVIEHVTTSKYKSLTMPGVFGGDGLLGAVTIEKEASPAGFRQMAGWGFTGLPPWPDAELYSQHPYTGILVIWLKDKNNEAG